MPGNIFHRLDVGDAGRTDVQIEEPLSRAELEKQFDVAPPEASCELEDFFTVASAREWRVFCTVRLPDETEHLSGELTFKAAAPDSGLPDLLIGALTKWREYGRAEAAEHSPMGGTYEPAGSVWIFRDMRVWRYGSSDMDTPAPATCNGPDLYVQSPTLPFQVHLERYRI